LAIIIGMIGFLSVGFYAWVSFYVTQDYKPDRKFFAIFAALELISITMGITIFCLLDVSLHIIWVSFTLLPIVLGTFLLFLYNFLSNHCRIY
jgi:hypothetical protein